MTLLFEMKDIALVTIRRSTFAAIQLERNRFAQEQRIWEEALGESLRSEAHRLASLAREGKLVLFLGSGVSAGAGLPTWRQLLLQLAQVAQMPEEEMALIDKMSFLDSARVIEMRLGGWKNLSHAIATRVQVSTYSLLCGLLAGLPVHEIVTTNYNQMFELSSRGVGLNVSVLPYYPIENCDRWILKMHGCVTHPEDIVLTREHYMRYQSTRSALSGIVQSLLITRHMLFVGFSLQDDNFHRIADEVRRSLRTISETESAAASSSSQTYTSGGHQEAPIVANLASPGIGDSNRPSESSSTAGLQLNYSASHSMRFGTQLYLISEPVTEILWKQDLNLVAMEKRANSSPAQAARRLEIFVDYLLSLATTTTAFLLNPQYDGLLDDNQRSLRDSLESFVEKISEGARKAPEWAICEGFLSELGWKGGNREGSTTLEDFAAENHGFCKSRA
eukprot:TRINITY_DN1202_c0_g1_i6.p1 TRINITY_DN1202_c0_g1~~TRINITY_DN1202_c0_g1_i6.p1  ORF type:complete len:448 (-),score=27.53 TRINITY_DN1202_c0_g1_i6:643-1986(-)